MKFAFRLILTVLMSLTSVALWAKMDAAHFAEVSQMSSGRWVKVSVDSCGVYQISHDKLRELGFANPSTVSVRGFGASALSGNNFDEKMPDDLPAASFVHTADGRLLFYGEGAVRVDVNNTGAITVKRNSSDVRGYYFLSDKPAEPKAIDAGHDFLAVELIEREEVNPGRGGAVYHEASMTDGRRSYRFRVKGHEHRDGFAEAILYYEFAALSGKPFAPEVILPTGLAEESRSVKAAMPTASVNGLFTNGHGQINFGGSVEDGEYEISFAMAEGTKADYAAMDKVALIYPSRESRLSFDEAQQYSEPKIVGEVAAQNLHGHDTPEMVIITTRDFYDAAEGLAEIHREYDGMTVRTVRQEDIFNEFSSGCRSTHAVRLYLKMLVERHPGVLKHVLLYGHSDYDRAKSAERGNLVCYETEDAEDASDDTSNYVSDKYFVMLEDNFKPKQLVFGKMSLNVGRIDVVRPEEGRKINSKIRRFVERQQDTNLYGEIVMYTGKGDANVHLYDAEERIERMSQYNSDLNFRRVQTVAYTEGISVKPEGRRLLGEMLKGGCGLMMYNGHSSMNFIGSEAIYDVAFVKQERYEDFPFAVILSCETYGFDRNSNELVNQMLSADNGGVIAAIASCRTMYRTVNIVVADAIVEQYALAQKETTIGDILRESHNNTVRSYSDLSRATNAICYNLCGDPALRIGAPDAKIKIETINGRPATETVEAEMLGRVRIAGIVEGCETFAGVATVRIFDKASTFTDQYGKEIQRDERLICEQRIAIAGGRFDAEIYIGESSVGSGTNRVVVTAISDDKTVKARGTCDALNIVDCTSEATTESAPRIEIGNIEIRPVAGKDKRSTRVTVEATIESESGLAMHGIGNMAALTIDGRRRVYPKVEITDSRHGRVVGEIDGLAAGRHKIEISATGSNGQHATETTEIEIGDIRATCSLTSDCRLAREECVMELTHNFADEPSGSLIITDDLGRTVFSRSGCSFPFVWDLRGNDGKHVSNGRYRAFAVVSDGFDRCGSNKLEIVVIR